MNDPKPFAYQPDKGTTCPNCGDTISYVVTIKPGMAFCESCASYVPLKSLV